jgi:hypothetical protein
MRSHYVKLEFFIEAISQVNSRFSCANVCRLQLPRSIIGIFTI